MGSWKRSILFGLPLAAALTSPGAVAAASPDSLTFVDESPLVVSFDGAGKADPVLVAMRNTGLARAGLVFRLLAQRGGVAVDGEFSVQAAPAIVGSNDASWFQLTFTRLSGSDEASGYIIVTDPSGAEPATRPVTFRTDERVIKFGVVTISTKGLGLPGGPGLILTLAALLALATVLARAAVARFKFADAIGLPKWDSKSLATEITLVSGALGTALAGVLPGDDQAKLLTSGQYLGLHVLCLGLVGVTPLIFSALQSGSKGANGVLFLGLAFAAFTAAIAEIITLLVGFADVAGSLGSGVLAKSLWLLALLAVVGVMGYGWKALAAGFVTPTNEDEWTDVALFRKPEVAGGVRRFSMF